jgi:probable addiction module antidote protein
MAKLTTTNWNPADHLETEADMAAYLEAAFEEGDPLLIAAALDDIASAESRRTRSEGPQ